MIKEYLIVKKIIHTFKHTYMNIIEQIIKKEKVRGMKQFICGDLKFRYTSFKEKELILPKKIKSDALADLIEKKKTK